MGGAVMEAWRTTTQAACSAALRTARHWKDLRVPRHFEGGRIRRGVQKQNAVQPPISAAYFAPSFFLNSHLVSEGRIQRIRRAFQEQRARADSGASQ